MTPSEHLGAFVGTQKKSKSAESSPRREESADLRRMEERIEELSRRIAIRDAEIRDEIERINNLLNQIGRGT